MRRPSMFEFAGGEPAFLALAAAIHERVLQDAELNHAFSKGSDPHHIEHLAAYLGEVFGGPARYSEWHGGHSAMLAIHAGNGIGNDWARRFVDCFMQAVDDAQLPDNREFRAGLRSFIERAVIEVESVAPPGYRVPKGMSTPRWSWEGGL